VKPNLVIAMDGPAGSGKSTVAKILSGRLGLALLDTGAMYRCLALSCIRLDVVPTDADRIRGIASGLDIKFEPGDPQKVFLAGEDVTQEIRSLRVGQAAASEYSTHPSVRKVMVARQQSIIAAGGVIVEGRDITTVVAPDAEVLIFLTASIEERARRRWLEMRERDPELRLQAVVRDVVERDHKDYTRGQSPLTLAEDAVIIESFGKSAEEVASMIEAMARGVD
jgi:cytidylate kinase